MSAAKPGRPPLERVRFDLVVAIDLGAEDLDDADARIAALEADLRPRLERMVRATRKGAPYVVHVHSLDPSYV